MTHYSPTASSLGQGLALNVEKWSSGTERSAQVDVFFTQCAVGQTSTPAGTQLVRQPAPNSSVNSSALAQPSEQMCLSFVSLRSLAGFCWSESVQMNLTWATRRNGQKNMWGCARSSQTPLWHSRLLLCLFPALLACRIFINDWSRELFFNVVSCCSGARSGWRNETGGKCSAQTAGHFSHYNCFLIAFQYRTLL